jgi:hypothetical protein
MKNLEFSAIEIAKNRAKIAHEFDKILNESKESILPSIDLSTTHHPRFGAVRVNVDFPPWMVDALTNEAMHLGVARQALIKMWIAEKLKDVA